MDLVNSKQTSARAFIRSLNILLKYARLYSFDHARTAEQFRTAWSELHAAIPVTNEAGLLLSATGSQLLLDGVPIDASPAERSFAQLLSAAGLASIQFTSRVTENDLERLARAFPTNNFKPSVLAEKLKTALAGSNIRINEVRFIAEDSSKETLAAGLLTAQSLGADTEVVKNWISDPEKLIQLIAAAEGSRGGSGDGSAGGGTGSSGNGEGGQGSAGAAAPKTGAAGSGGPGIVGPAGAGDAGSGAGTAAGSGKGTGGGIAAGTGNGGTADGGSAANGTEATPAGSSPYSGTLSGNELLRGGEQVEPSAIFGARADAPVTSAPAGPAPASGGQAKARGIRTAGAGAGGMSPFSTKEDDILGILKLLTSLGQTVTGGGAGLEPGPLQEELTRLPAQSQDMLRKALAAVAEHAPSSRSKGQVLLRLAEHLAIKFALERYERGEVKVNAVRTMMEKMSQEIDGLRKILGSHEQKLANAGVMVESTSDLLDRQFWASVPERGKLTVLTSPEAWCIPPRNLRQFVEELLKRGEEAPALAILQNYAASMQSEEFEARRRSSIGIADLADLYASLGGRPLGPAIKIAGAQLCLERDDNLQGLISAAFVRLAQEAGLKRLFPALVQALDSLDSVEHQRLVLAQSLRPRVGLEKRVPEFLEDVLRGDRDMKGLEILLQRVPRSSAESLISRFNRTSSRADMQRLVDLAHSAGDELLAALRDALRSGSASEAAEAAGLLSRLDPAAVERWLPGRIADWPRQAQDRAVRLVAMSGAAQRGSLLVELMPALDAVLLPLAIDEIGLSEDDGCIAALLRVAEGNETRSNGMFVRLKAVEALGRLKALEAAEFLRAMAEARHMFHWVHPAELRLAAVQSLAKIDAGWARDFVARSGFTTKELALAPLDPLPNAKYFRRRRYPRVKLSEPITAIATVGPDSYRLEIRGLSLSGGIAAGEKHLTPGTLVSMRLGTGLRPIRAQVLMRDARAQGLGFEFADMELDERSRLRKLLLENNPSAFYQEENVATPTSA